ncbi:hypothetical protein DNTS_015370 [Danionella cerebrum]|uniref:Uncharacterized protein n=1 Tax=Danionella cerebrum TaxID=2873325 RepID=A0A553NWX1_9TELE|nr:hypothetical protein DNTS_015370 [Danionella translucida]
MAQIMRRNPFAAEGCCRKGSRNALEELYNPTQLSRGQINSLPGLISSVYSDPSHSLSHAHIPASFHPKPNLCLSPAGLSCSTQKRKRKRV